MQRVCAVSGGVNASQADPECLITPETSSCLFCDDGHRLRRHGWYERQAVFPDPEVPRKVAVVRLLCARTGQTISLLPDFCLARRQHGPAVLALFLEAFVRGRALLEALRSVRQDAPSHGVAQSLRDGLLRQAAKIRAYLARRRGVFEIIGLSLDSSVEAAQRFAKRHELKVGTRISWRVDVNRDTRKVWSVCDSRTLSHRTRRQVDRERFSTASNSRGTRESARDREGISLSKRRRQVEFE